MAGRITDGVRSCLLFLVVSFNAVPASGERNSPLRAGGIPNRPSRAPILATVNARSVSFTATHFTLGHRDPDYDRPTLELHVKAMRPAFLRIDAVSKPVITPSPDGRSTSYTFHGSVSNLMVSNAAGLFENVPSSKTVVRHNPVKRLEGISPHVELADRAQIYYLFGGSLADFRRVGAVRVAGRPAVLYRPSTKDPDVMEQYAIYVDPKTRLPIRISRVDTDNQGKEVELNYTDYSNWRLNTKMESVLFQFTPPAGSTIKPGKPNAP
jgi:outer membrane lipoprotein-sorting protein